jgi:hypothetical protein
MQEIAAFVRLCDIGKMKSEVGQIVLEKRELLEENPTAFSLESGCKI